MRFYAWLLAPVLLFADIGYVTNYGSNTVSVFDTDTNAVTTTITVGEAPNGIVLVNGYAYVANSGSNTVSVIDTSINTVTNTIVVDTGPYAFAQSGTDLYVANLFGDMDMDGSVYVIDTLSNTVTASIFDASFNGPIGIGILGTQAYVANFGAGSTGMGNTISVIDTMSNTVVDVITLASPSIGPIAVGFYGTDAYVVDNFPAGNVVVIDTMSNTISATISSMDFNYPYYIEVDGSTGYVTNNGVNTMSVIDLSMNSVIDTVPISSNMGSGPQGMAITGSTAYIANTSVSSVSVVDLMGYTYMSLSDPESTLVQPAYIVLFSGGEPSSRAFGRPANRR